MTFSKLRQMRESGSDEPIQIEAVKQFEFPSDIEAHDESLQTEKYAEMLSEFERAVAEGIAIWGTAIDESSDVEWLAEVPIAYDRVAAWKDGSTISFLALSHEDRECPILILAGVLLLS